MLPRLYNQAAWPSLSDLKAGAKECGESRAVGVPPPPHANPRGDLLACGACAFCLTAIPSQPLVPCLLTSLHSFSFILLHPSSTLVPLHFAERLHSFGLYTYFFVISYYIVYHDPSSCLTLNPKFVPCQSLSRSSLPIRQCLSANPALPRHQTHPPPSIRNRRSRLKPMPTDEQTVTVPLPRRRRPTGSH